MASFRFGDYELSEEGRALHCRGVEVPMQPRVFDLLTFLLRHHNRVVTKDELMSALWPGVTVTEASLQRLVSLARNALREGGMDGAIRSFPKIGYRFCETVTDAREDAPVQTAAAADEKIGPAGLARSLMRQRRWAEAAAAFEKADLADQLNAADLEQWALALECAGTPEMAIDILRRSAIAHDMGGNHRAAAKAALSIAKIHLERNETAAARGWHARAAKLIGEERDNREYGLLCWMGARLAAADGEPERALALSNQAYEIGRSLGEAEIEALGLIYRGFYKLCLGDTQSGLEDQDHAAALALSSGLDPVTGSTIYCNILWACRNFGDWERASQWTLGYQKWCSDCGIHNFTGSCQLHRAELLGVQGTLAQAEQLIAGALETLSCDAPWAIGDAYRVLGDIHRIKGELDKAERAYESACAVGWDPQPGLALLQHEKGNGAAALSGLERAMVGRAWPTLQRRGLLLAHLALIAARNGMDARAWNVIREIESEPGRWTTPSIRAVVAEAKADLFAQEGTLAAAIEQLEIARHLWSRAGAAYNAAEVRLRLAERLVEQGNPAGAETEIKAARFVAERLESARLLRWSERLGGQLDNPSPA
ncbi:winged helix-turn-helix domain-containing protein [Chelativorans intermedius]|uniref:Winged helix-turn-helix domain-containing protein n=1 Tax=Chelativorans intermedius TaxID=515947 RepID=A0ABV6D7D0_9HYPH|nr:winged helix-turn-helix domain-containing protein [Chelativorans intermedius]MCT8999285.1 winged helix-turn-helix domain-containing protein [Chelativorans intermedius]